MLEHAGLFGRNSGFHVFLVLAFPEERSLDERAGFLQHAVVAGDLQVMVG